MVIMAIALLLFIGFIWFFTRYTIEGEKLIVKSGFMKQTIDIQKITSLRNTKSIIAAPALSIQRLEINYHPYESTQISPKSRTLFVENLQKINPETQVVEDDK